MNQHHRYLADNKPINMGSGASASPGRHQGELADGQSIFNMLEHVILQVEYKYLADSRTNFINPFYNELCLIIAEVLVMSHDSFLKINGSLIPVPLVQEIYSQLRCDHLQLVFENFHNVTQRVYNKKAYLTTALYNVVFEINSHYFNEMVCDRMN